MTMLASGLRQYANADILLLGGYSRSGDAPEGTIGAGFAAYDRRRMTGDMPEETAKLGTVEIFLIPPQLRLFHGLVRIDVVPALRRQGNGRRIIEALAATAPDEQLRIYDVQQDALAFWIQLGCTFQARPPAWDALFRLAAPQPTRAGSPLTTPPRPRGVTRA